MTLLICRIVLYLGAGLVLRGPLNPELAQAAQQVSKQRGNFSTIISYTEFIQGWGRGDGEAEKQRQLGVDK